MHFVMLTRHTRIYLCAPMRPVAPSLFFRPRDRRQDGRESCARVGHDTNLPNCGRTCFSDLARDRHQGPPLETAVSDPGTAANLVPGSAINLPSCAEPVVSCGNLRRNPNETRETPWEGNARRKPVRSSDKLAAKLWKLAGNMLMGNLETRQAANNLDTCAVETCPR